MNRIIGVLIMVTLGLWTNIAVAEQAADENGVATSVAPDDGKTPPTYGPPPSSSTTNDPYYPYGPRSADWEAARQERLNRKIEAKKRGRPLIMAGAISLGAGYVFSAVLASVLLVDMEESNAAYMYIPIVGNPIYFSRIIKEQKEQDRLYGEDEFDDVEDEANFALAMGLFIPAVAQVTGTVLLSLGLTKRSRYKNEYEKVASLSVAPIVTNETRGLSLSMSF